MLENSTYIPYQLRFCIRIHSQHCLVLLLLVPSHSPQTSSTSLQLVRHQGTHMIGQSVIVRHAHHASVTVPVIYRLELLVHQWQIGHRLRPYATASMGGGLTQSFTDWAVWLLQIYIPEVSFRSGTDQLSRFGFQSGLKSWSSLSRQPSSWELTLSTMDLKLLLVRLVNMNLNKLLAIDSPIPDATSVIFNVDHLLFANRSKIHIKLIDSNEKFVRIKSEQDNTFSSVGLSNNRVVTGTTQGHLQFHEISDLNRCSTRKAHHGQISALSTHDDLVLTGSRDKTVKLWSLKSKDKPLHVFAGHRNWVTTVDLGRNPGEPHRFVSGGLDKVVKLWDIETGKHWESVPLDSEVGTVTFDPQRKHICASTEHYLLLIDPFNDKITQCYPIPQPTISIIHFDNLVMTCHEEAPTQLFDIVKGQKMDFKGIQGTAYCRFKDYLAALVHNECKIYRIT